MARVIIRSERAIQKGLEELREAARIKEAARKRKQERREKRKEGPTHFGQLLMEALKQQQQEQ